jgi:hypothetical protein
MSNVHRDAIEAIAFNSDIRGYDWLNRGSAPLGYVQGMALCFATTLSKLSRGEPAAVEMAKADTNDSNLDAMTHYRDKFSELGMSNDEAGTATLRHLYVLLLGLGMRESSGQHCEGRDMAANNDDAETCETGLFQFSYNSRSKHPRLPELIDAYRGETLGLPTFRKGVRCDAASWKNWGEGPGVEFQQLAKQCPAFAVDYAAVLLRNNRRHFGPINRRRAELRPEADAMFLEVEAYVTSHGGPDVWSEQANAVPSPNILGNLEGVFRQQVEQLIAVAAERQLELVPTSGLRDPWEQARLWRRSRSGAQVQSKVAELRAGGGPYLADILQAVGPQPNGSWRTDAPPGLSWHQLGQSVDFGIRSPASGRVLEGDRRADGAEYDFGQDSYDRLGEMCRELGLKWGGDFGDQNHVQRSPAGSPLAEFSLPEVDAKIRELWPQQP